MEETPGRTGCIWDVNVMDLTEDEKMWIGFI
jgi:hypothetical protein